MDGRDLGDRLEGRVSRAGEDGFAQACALWNARFDGRLDLAVRCLTADDVAACVDLARADGLRLSVKGGGHSYAGNTIRDGGLLIDLSAMSQVSVDPDARTVTVGGGATCGHVDAATQTHALAMPLPTVSSVGVAGAALGGGSGYLSRKHGLSLDNLISVDVVTASGAQVRASEDENPDLFWALRGGGGNFGVATSLTFRLHELGPDVLAGQVIYPFDDAAELLRAYVDFMERAPDELQCYPFMFRIPPVEPFPEAFHGRPALDFVVCHQDAGALDAVQPLRELGPTILDVVGPTPYTQVQQAFDPNLPAGQRYYSKAHYVDRLTDSVIETVVANVERMQGVFTAAYFEPLGRAIADVDPAATAFWGRSAAYGFHIIAGWTDAADDGSVMGWARTFHDEMAAHATGGVYVNLIADDERVRVPAAYGDNWERLVDLKKTWDPDNLFQGNHNIPPAG
jgi:FAD/FMN-containing dehydrogenase